MNDRELLELAAKAEGITLHAVGNGDGEVVFYTYPDMLFWNPLTDDGDALRLAGDIGLVVCIMRNAGFTGIYLPACRIGGKYDEVQHHGEDEFAATRRAIVRAAAAIGERMQ